MPEIVTYYNYTWTCTCKLKTQVGVYAGKFCWHEEWLIAKLHTKLQQEIARCEKEKLQEETVYVIFSNTKNNSKKSKFYYYCRSTNNNSEGFTTVPGEFEEANQHILSALHVHVEDDIYFLTEEGST
jgi:hypothetical protein